MDQRTWPDPAGLYDDSAHAVPGQWSVDYLYQRPVWTPHNFEGDLPNTRDLVDGGFDACKTGEVTLDGETHQQYVYGRYLPVNSQSGPSRMENGVPAGYAHSPQGAVLFALALMSYGKPDAGDEVGFAIDDAWWSTYQPLQDEQSGYASREGLPSARAVMLPPPSFYRVVDCSESVVVVEVGIDFSASGDGAFATALPLYWRDGDWELDLTGPAGKRFDSPGSFNPENAEPLKAVRYE